MSPVRPAIAGIGLRQKRSVKVAHGTGANGPGGPTLELPPGKYKVSMKAAGQLAIGEDVVVGAGETWGFMGGSRRIGADANPATKGGSASPRSRRLVYAVRPFSERPSAACAAARRAIGMRKGEHET